MITSGYEAYRFERLFLPPPCRPSSASTTATQVITPERMWLQWIDPSVVGDQAFVDEAVRDGVAEAEQLRIDQVRPFGTKDNGPQLLRPVSD